MNSNEATFICVDNSDYNRNEDVLPNRFMSQIDCINVICCNRTSVNYENHIGILVMAGKRIKVKAALTNDVAKLLSCINDIQIEGTCDVLRSLSIAQLALKQRVNKNLKQKILLFITSPVIVKESHLLNTAKQLKKNNICVDIISIGHVEENREILKKLYENVNNVDNCKYIEVPQNEENLSKFVLSSIADLPFGQGSAMNSGDVTLSELELLNGSEHALNNTTTDARGGTSNNLDALPTEEDIANMHDIDPDLRDALLLSLREYNEACTTAAKEQQNEHKDETNPNEKENQNNNDNKENETNTSAQATAGNTETNANETKSEEKQNRKRQNECISIGSENYKSGAFSHTENGIDHEKKEKECCDKAFKMMKTESGKNLKYENTDVTTKVTTKEDKDVVAKNDRTLSQNQPTPENDDENNNKTEEVKEKEKEETQNDSK